MTDAFRTVAPVRPRELAPRTTRPSFSVVVAAYQAAGVVTDALDSVYDQTEPPHEVVVIDDGSTDKTASVVSAYGRGVSLIQKENGGEASAKNAGVRASSGDFVVFLDADDTFAPTRLEALADLAVARPDLDVLTTDAWLEVAGTRVRRCYDETWTFPEEHQRIAILQRNFVFGLAAVPRSTFLAAGGFDETLRHATDWDLWCRLILTGSRVGLVAEPLAVYRLRSDSLSANRTLLLHGRCRVLAKALAREDLSPLERAVARASLQRETRNALVTETQVALLGGSPSARTHAWKLLTASGIPTATRLRALLAVLAPRLAARALVRAGRDREVPGQADLTAWLAGVDRSQPPDSRRRS